MENRYFNLTSEDLIINVKSMDDFTYKVNYYLDQKIKENLKEKNIIYEEAEIDAYNKLISKINVILTELYPNEYNSTFKHYFEELNSNYNIKTANAFLTLVGNFFIEKIGKDIPIEKVIDVAANVNQNVFGLDEKQKEEYKKELLDNNKEKDKEDFPYYYKEYYEKYNMK